jgi:pilus assembly protein FimV
MHSSNQSQLASFSRKTLSAAVLSALLCTSAYAAGLGKLTVLSSLGQPLRAEIELTSVAKDEAGTIVAKLASAEAYRQANIEMTPALFSLRFAVETRGDRQFVRVTSAQPVNEPFMALLIELGGTNNRLMREYTFLLDPADLRMGQSTQVAATPGAGGRNSASSQSAMTQAAAVPQPEAQQKPMAQQKPAVQQARPQRAARSEAPREQAAGSENYQVKSGDTLAQIAGQLKPEGVSLDQMLVALYRANTQAFVGNNMNRLRAGQILSVPDADAAKTISKSEARGVIVAQAADFNAYRNNLAGQVAASAQPKKAESSQSAGGKITAQVEEKPTAANESKDKLKLSKAGAAAKGAAGASSGIAAGTEDQIAKEKALAEANSRVKELEKNVGDLQKLLEVKNKDLAAQQKQLDAKAAAAAPAPAPAAAKEAAPAVAAAPAASAAPAAPADAVKTPAAQADAGKAPATDANASADKPAEQAAAEKPVEAPAAVKPAPAKPKKVVAPPPPPPETSFLDDLLGNTVLLSSLGAGLLAGLGALGFYRMRRKKQEQPYDDSILADSSLKANSLFGSTGGQSVDTSNSVFNSSFQPAASQLDANEVDPVAEADVYIAYGRDAQAEEILKEALRTQPERHAVRLKLLEIYSSRKDVRAFETVATELYSMTKGEGAEWPEAAAMGAALDPNNPLYAGAKPMDSTAGAAANSPATEPMDAELDELLSTTDPHQSTFGALDTLGANSAYFATTMASDLPPASEAEVPEMPSAEDEAHAEAEAPSANVLDFDLAGLNLQPPSEPKMDASPKETAPEASTDLDFGTLDFSLEQNPQVSAEEADSPRTAMSVDVGSDDLSFLSAEVPSLTEEPAPQESAPLESASMDFDLSDISLDLNPSESKVEAESPKVSADDLAAPTLDFSTANTMLDLTQSAPSFDQPQDINLDLPQDQFESNLITETEDDSSPESEMATKLDLAIAYQEIGDRDGARELLDEVIKGGNSEQSEKAKSLLEALA